MLRKELILANCKRAKEAKKDRKKKIIPQVIPPAGRSPLTTFRALDDIVVKMNKTLAKKTNLKPTEVVSQMITMSERRDALIRLIKEKGNKPPTP